MSKLFELCAAITRDPAICRAAISDDRNNADYAARFDAAAEEIFGAVLPSNPINQTDEE